MTESKCFTLCFTDKANAGSLIFGMVFAGAFSRQKRQEKKEEYLLLPSLVNKGPLSIFLVMVHYVSSKMHVFVGLTPSLYIDSI